MSETPKKKSLWELLNTPVQDLVKKGDEPAAAVSTPPAAPAEAKAEPSAAPIESKAAPAAPAAEKAPSVEKAVEKPVEAAVEKPAGPATAPAPAAASVAQTEPVAKPEPALKAEPVAKAEPIAKAEPAAAAPPVAEPVAETAPAAAPEPAADSEKAAPKLRKKSLWEVLNTPVQDLFKEGQLLVEDDADVALLGLGRDKPVLEGGEKQSWLAHFRARLARTRSQFTDSITRLAKGRTKVDEDMLEELEEILLQSDMGVKTTDDVLEYLRGEAKKRRFLPEEVLPSLTGYLEQTLESEPFRLVEGKLNIFLIVGVNGTGKTTTVGKVAAKLKISGYRVMLAAGDTFRAAAIDQLAIWGTRVGCPVIQHHEGADAAAVVYDAIQSARAKNVDALLIDTAGRLHNKDHLMEELKKVHRIIEREKLDAHVENILVLDATTGQNGLRQAEVFSKSVPLDSLILTKLDGTAKGGVIFGIKRELGIPIKLLGVGETLGDLQEFEPKSFVQALFAQDNLSEEAAASQAAEVS